jgi:hypothetical protein
VGAAGLALRRKVQDAHEVQKIGIVAASVVLPAVDEHDNDHVALGVVTEPSFDGLHLGTRIAAALVIELDDGHLKAVKLKDPSRRLVGFIGNHTEPRAWSRRIESVHCSLLPGPGNQ